MRERIKRKTKIAATLGPASSSPEVIRKMIEAGMNAARLNFSHGTHAEHLHLLNTIRSQAAELGRNVAVFQDLCGPKVRISKVLNEQIVLAEGASIELHYAKAKEAKTFVGDTSKLYIDAFNPAEVMLPGEKALLADGRIILIAQSINKGVVTCQIISGGALRSRSGISVPDSHLDLPCLTEKDISDMEWGVKNNVDYIALSFVRSLEDIRKARNAMAEFTDTPIPVIAKIERAGSLDHVSGIVESADAVMVARGDLGLELPLERVPSAQRFIIRSSNFAGTPVITATQMLMSMVTELRPTRAEVSDVATAVRDGTDAVMLSDETSIGKHPIESIRVLSNIVEEAERELDYEVTRPSIGRRADLAKVADAVCYAACSAADKVSSDAILACTQSGKTARLLAKYRPDQTLFGATSQLRSLNRMALYWGVVPVLIEIGDDADTEEEVTQAMIAVRDQFGVKPGTRVVITAGLRTKSSGATNLMEIREIPRTA